MAHPVKDPEHSRTERANVRLSPAEFRRVASKAESAGLTVTGFMREAALNKRVSVVQSTAPDIHTRQALQRIGNNLNQIAKHLNARPHPQLSPPLALEQSLQELQGLLTQWYRADDS